MQRILVTVITLLLLSQFAPAETWKAGRLSFSTNGDFQKKPVGSTGAELNLFDAKANTQILVAPAPNGTNIPAKKVKEAWPVLYRQNNWEAFGQGVLFKLAGREAVLFEFTDKNDPTFQTIYVYLETPGKPHTILLNYPSPRDPAKFQIMKRLLSTVRTY